MKIVKLTSCETSFEANLIKGRLENEGIQCFLTNENFNTMMPIFGSISGGGIHLMIHEQDFERAKSIIDTDESE
ncbi:MAG: DUF2007 domain-containing protein [Chitinophagaceae bacterium]|nr:MAG: DUF2007 domain-containing protein [Chitinophagaceae bacterium]